MEISISVVHYIGVLKGIGKEDEVVERKYFTILLYFEFLQKLHLPSGKLRIKFTSSITKSTSPGLSDTTFFACCLMLGKIVT